MSIGSMGGAPGAGGFENKTERHVLTLDEVKNMVILQLGNKAKIEKLDVVETNEGLRLSVKLNAGFTGGKISIDGEIVNVGNEIGLQNLHIEARGYVKSMIESNLSNFVPAMKKYFEDKYGKPVHAISIAGSSLILDLKNTSA